MKRSASEQHATRRGGVNFMVGSWCRSHHSSSTVELAERARKCQEYKKKVLRLRESSNFCYLKLKLQVTKVTDVCTVNEY